MAYISNCGDDAELGLNPSRTEVHSAEETRQQFLAVKCDCCADKLAAMAQAFRDEDVEKVRFAYDAVSLCNVMSPCKANFGQVSTAWLLRQDKG